MWSFIVMGLNFTQSGFKNLLRRYLSAGMNWQGIFKPFVSFLFT